MSKKISGKVIGVWEKNVSLNIGSDSDPLVLWHSDFRRHNKQLPNISDVVTFSYDVRGRKAVGYTVGGKEFRGKDAKKAASDYAAKVGGTPEVIKSKSLYCTGVADVEVREAVRSQLIPDEDDAVLEESSSQQEDGTDEPWEE